MNQIDPFGHQITLIHFTHEVGDSWRIACMPGMTEFHATPYHPAYQRSNDTRAVTCPGCKRSAVFLQYKGTLETNLKGPIRAS